MLKEEVGPEEIAAIVSKWTGIPMSKLQEEDRVKLLRLDKELHERVVGQDEAVSAVATAVLRSRCTNLPPTLELVYVGADSDQKDGSTGELR
jgi:ATP-dependent Clp protease ATP-binding subunit ClpB